MWTCPSSPCSGASPDGWQLRQRGESKTVRARLTPARDAAASDLAAPPSAPAAATTACAEFDEVTSAACCCASVGRHAAKIAETKRKIKIGHFFPKPSLMFAPSP